MKTQKSLPLTSVALAAAALSLSPLALAQSASSSSAPAATPTQDVPSGTGASLGQSGPGRTVDRVDPPAAAGSAMERPVAPSAAYLAAPDQSSGPQRFSELRGQSVKGTGDADLGQVRDVVIDAQSGQATFVIVGSGGVLGFGGTRRAVPLSALQPATSGEGWTVELDQARWDQAPEFRDADLATLTRDGEGERVYQFYGVQWPETSVGATTAATTASNNLLASELDGIDLLSGEQEAGEIEDVLIDARRGLAAILVDTESEFVEGEAPFVLGWNQLTVGGSGSDVRITTELTAADFQGAQPLVPGAELTGDEPYLWSEQPALAATSTAVVESDDAVVATSQVNEPAEKARVSGAYGTSESEPAAVTAEDEPVRYSSATANPQNRPQGPRSTADASSSEGLEDDAADKVAAVRTALRDDPDLADVANDLTVRRDGDTIVLGGEVESSLLRERIVNRARLAAAGVTIENEIEVTGAAE